MKKRFLSLPLITNFIIFLSVFIGAIYIPQDPDLGWHLKYGEYFFKTGHILRTNPYTQLMPDFRWNNSSWLTDLITYSSYHLGGFIALSVLSALVVTATFYFMSKSAKLSIFEKSIIFPIILYFLSSLNFISFRGQLLSLLFLSILYFILFKFEENKKNAFFLIPLFMIWGNLHGEYILGLAVLAIWTTVYISKEIILTYKSKIKKLIVEERFLLSSFVASFFAVLINPFGVGVYEEALHHFRDPLQKSVTEFVAPADFSAVWWHLIFCGLIMFVGLLLLGLSRKNWDKAPFYVPSVVLLLLTFWVRRYAWPFYYSAIFLFQPVVHFFEPDNKKHSKYASFFIAILFLLGVALVKYPIHFKSYNWDSYCSDTVKCSHQAAKFVISHHLNNNKLLTMYDSGGFLIWNYPQIKPTIDGRMHLWKDKNGFSGFGYYYPIEQNTTNDVQITSYNSVLASKQKPIYKHLLFLSNQGKWKEIYSDKYSAIFVRSN